MNTRVKRMGVAAADSSLTKVKTLKLYVADEAGVVMGRPVTLWLDKRGTPSFVFKVPDYVQRALDVPEQINDPVAESAERKFVATMREYAEWKKNAVAMPVIVLHVGYVGRNKDGSAIDSEHHVRFGSDARKDREQTVDVAYYLAFKVNGKVYQREEERTGEWPQKKTGKFVVGSMIAYPGGEVLDYTPELHAKIDMICDALNGAALALDGIVKAKDMAKALLTFGPKHPMLEAPKEKRPMTNAQAVRAGVLKNKSVPRSVIMTGKMK
jgi:hypothetical protein